VAYVAIDIRRKPDFRVTRWHWLLVSLYMGSDSSRALRIFDKEPAPGTHEEFIRPLWKQAHGSIPRCRRQRNGHHPPSDDARHGRTQLLYWGTMSAAVIVAWSV
jgi:hypothetical protein